MWIYSQSSGLLTKDGIHVGYGYSGAEPDGKNNPAMEATPNVGPIPQGDWMISGPPQDTKEHGPYVLKLDPKDGTFTFGRSGFIVHGDSLESPGTASKGCIVANRIVRTRIWQSGDADLQVIP